MSSDWRMYKESEAEKQNIHNRDLSDFGQSCEGAPLPISDANSTECVCIKRSVLLTWSEQAGCGRRKMWRILTPKLQCATGLPVMQTAVHWWFALQNTKQAQARNKTHCALGNTTLRHVPCVHTKIEPSISLWPPHMNTVRTVTRTGIFWINNHSLALDGGDSSQYNTQQSQTAENMTTALNLPSHLGVDPTPPTLDDKIGARSKLHNILLVCQRQTANLSHPCLNVTMQLSKSMW